MSRPVHTKRGDIVITEACGCRHAGGSYVAHFAADEGKVGPCAPHKAEWDADHAQAQSEHARAQYDRANGDLS